MDGGRMWRSLEIKELASRLGLDVPKGEDYAVLADIADQLGLEGYAYSPENNDILYSALKDLERAQSTDDYSSDYMAPTEVLMLEDNSSNNEEPKKESPKEEKKDDEDKEENKDKDDTKEKGANDNKNESAPDDEQIGNGYGSDAQQRFRNKDKNNNETKNDNTSNGNYNHNKAVEDGKKAEEAASSAQKQTKDLPATSDASNAAAASGTGGQIAQAAQLKNAASDPKEAAKNIAKEEVKKKVVEFLAANPEVLIAIIVAVIFILLIMILMLITMVNLNRHDNNQNGNNCSYNLNGILSTGTANIENVSVELINCDGTPSNYRVLQTVNFEKYVLGVALAEIGESSPTEAIKAQIVSARNFALTRNIGMCPGNQDNCFYGYNKETNVIRMRACEADQVYWDYDKDIYRENRGSISIYSPEINSGTLWKSKLSEEKKQELLAVASEVKGEVLLDSSSTSVLKVGYNSTVSRRFIEAANEGKDYKEILNIAYGSSNINSGTCNNYAGNIDYGEYQLSSDGDRIISQSLSTFLSSKGTSVEAFNSLINENVNKSGYGTRAGVVAAAVTLIAELGNQYDVKIPYYWGGGHYDGIAVGSLAYWGEHSCHTRANGKIYNQCGLDCSGFVPWAIKNGGFNIGQRLANQFQRIPGARRVSLSPSNAVLSPGDLLESRGHVVLIVAVDEEHRKYICAEASGLEEGVQFTRRNFAAAGYWGVDMEGFYANTANIRRNA